MMQTYVCEIAAEIGLESVSMLVSFTSAVETYGFKYLVFKNSC